MKATELDHNRDCLASKTRYGGPSGFANNCTALGSVCAPKGSGVEPPDAARGGVAALSDSVESGSGAAGGASRGGGGLRPEHGLPDAERLPGGRRRPAGTEAQSGPAAE